MGWVTRGKGSDLRPDSTPNAGPLGSAHPLRPPCSALCCEQSVAVLGPNAGKSSLAHHRFPGPGGAHGAYTGFPRCIPHHDALGRPPRVHCRSRWFRHLSMHRKWDSGLWKHNVWRTWETPHNDYVYARVLHRGQRSRGILHAQSETNKTFRCRLPGRDFRWSSE